MKSITKFMVFALLALFSASFAFADPVSVTGVQVQENNGDYIVLVSLLNENVSTGDVAKLSFTVEELGVSKDNVLVIVDSTSPQVETYNLRDVVDSFDLLKKGNTYQITVSSDDGTSQGTSFLFGSEKDTNGLGVLLEGIEINDNEVSDIDTLQVVNGETLNIELRFTALENFDNARFRAFIDGYEHASLFSSTQIFSAVEGKTYVKTFSLQLPSDMSSEKDYKLRIEGANDLSGLTAKDYTIYVDTQRDRIDILDLVMTPSSGVEPGQNVIANVRLKNRGQQAQDSIKVSVEIPELNVEESSYVSNLAKDEVATSDDMLLFIPQDAKAGQYEATVTLSYDDGYTRTTDSFVFTVVSPRAVDEQNLLVSFKDGMTIAAGEKTSFDVVVANPNDESKPISIAALNAAWADVSVSPSLAMVKGGDSETFTVTITPDADVEGEQELTLLVKEGSQIASEVKVKLVVEEGKVMEESSVNFVNIALAVLLVIAIIILLVLIITIAKRRGDDEKETSSTEEYY
ncbi:MAG: hypothetical protein H6500_01225 [Candidatus Woesearchaeota archaeon]|nr:MAG: hypothetical protein H6500_01225 [Candidatus Woesearchaeota archaeon]